ncbi:DUF2510 domain-containing protein [Tessaracoccus sp. OS52]|uniref:DUF2510 domain-containing protein n=1 Tax=Tessaracoccus sp. OS52 TaxID=2886691 RepID=UPI001D1305F0|nr:DUF2510 domain-containing protein [Tessaracoccus sp. OS52]MCC2593480.1 DUF2510 domain-containing protein [Tessaracoccus sp. OS52]
MSAPGWYPDPASNDGGLRYWDGTAWTSHTTSGPAVGQAGPGAPRRRPPWLWFGLALVVVVAVVVALLWRPGSPFSTTPEDTNSARPTGSQWNELEPTESPTNPDATGRGELIDCPRNSTDDRSQIGPDGRIHGGGLSFEAVRDWRNIPVYLPWLYDHNSQTRSITGTWMSNLSVGAVLKEEGFTSPRQSAESIMSCMSTSLLYDGFTGREDLSNEAFSLDGAQGWRITANVYVDNQGPIRGDVVDVIVLDLGEADRFSVFISCATIDDRDNLSEVAAATESLRVG